MGWTFLVILILSCYCWALYRKDSLGFYLYTIAVIFISGYLLYITFNYII